MARNDYLNPKEYRDGFYVIPGYPDYVINKQGVVKDKCTWATLKPLLKEMGYAIVSLRYSFPNTKLRLSKQCKVHRLMGITFLSTGEFQPGDLQVNHKDYNRANNSLDNLEWVTPSENVEYSKNNPNYNLRIGGKVTVQVRNIETKEIKTYPSIIACSMDLNIQKDVISDRLNNDPRFVYPGGYQFRKINFDKPWPEWKTNKEKIYFNMYGNVKPALLKEHLKSGLVTEFPSSRELAKYLGIAESTLSCWFNYKNQPVLPGLVQIQYKENFKPWREVRDPWLEYMNFQHGKKAVQAVRVSTGEKFIYESAVECAKAHGIKPSTLNWRLKSQGTIVYDDGYRYGYYPFD